jgi:hypothetical protein
VRSFDVVTTKTYRPLKGRGAFTDVCRAASSPLYNGAKMIRLDAWLYPSGMDVARLGIQTVKSDREVGTWWIHQHS